MNAQTKVAVRPYYVQVKDLLKADFAQEGLLERERKLAVEAILSQAPSIGIEKALELYGEALLPTEHKILASLTKEDLEALQRLRGKLGDLLSTKGLTINLHRG
jgi:hypothetical protein